MTAPQTGPRMNLREKLVELADALYAEGDQASARKSYVEGNALRTVANRIRVALDLPELTHSAADTGSEAAAE